MPSITNILRLSNVFAPLVVSILLIIFAAFDIMHHIAMADAYNHILTETSVFFLGFLVNLYFVHRAVQEIEFLKLERQKTKEGLHRAIEEQLQTWELSPSEVEIAFLVLKGLTNKEIAEVRSTSESTVRLQCSAVYKKSKLNSRSELAAYFLEDIL